MKKQSIVECLKAILGITAPGSSIGFRDQERIYQLAERALELYRGGARPFQTNTDRHTRKATS